MVTKDIVFLFIKITQFMTSYFNKRMSKMITIDFSHIRAPRIFFPK